MGRNNNQKYNIKKLKLSSTKKYALLVLVLGIIFGICMNLKENKDSIISAIKRNSYGEGAKEIELEIDSKFGKDNLLFELPEREYSKEEIDVLFSQFIKDLPTLIKGDNKSLNEVNGNLLLEDYYEDYPFYCEFSISNPEIISSSGVIQNDVSSATPITIEINVSYLEFSATNSFGVVVIPKDMSDKEVFMMTLTEEILKTERENRSSEYVDLPKSFQGKSIDYRIVKNNKSLRIFAYVAVISVLLFFYDSFMHKENEKKRKEEIRRLYPNFAQKFSMLSGAGLTPRQIFNKMGENYLKKSEGKNPLYDEILIINRELSSGIPEIKAYENFDKRCGVREISTFVSIVNQNMKKGAISLNTEIRKLSAESFRDQKGEIRKKGELAGSKLLFPMLIMLVIVFVMIMVPAFSSFSSLG